MGSGVLGTGGTEALSPWSLLLEKAWAGGSQEPHRWVSGRGTPGWPRCQNPVPESSIRSLAHTTVKQTFHAVSCSTRSQRLWHTFHQPGHVLGNQLQFPSRNQGVNCALVGRKIHRFLGGEGQAVSGLWAQSPLCQDPGPSSPVVASLHIPRTCCSSRLMHGVQNYLRRPQLFDSLKNGLREFDIYHLIWYIALSVLRKKWSRKFQNMQLWAPVAELQTHFGNELSWSLDSQGFGKSQWAGDMAQSVFGLVLHGLRIALVSSSWDSSHTRWSLWPAGASVNLPFWRQTSEFGDIWSCWSRARRSWSHWRVWGTPNANLQCGFLVLS